MCQLALNLDLNKLNGLVKAFKFTIKNNQVDLFHKFLERDDITKIIEATKLSLYEFLLAAVEDNDNSDGSIKNPKAQEIIRDFYFTCDCEEIEFAIANPLQFILDHLHGEEQANNSYIRESLSSYRIFSLSGIAATKGFLPILEFFESDFKPIYAVKDLFCKPLNFLLKYQVKPELIPFIANLGNLPTDKNRVGLSVLHIAVSQSDIIKVNALLDVCDTTQKTKLVNLTDLQYRSPLHLACISGDLSIVQTLLDAGAEFNQRDQFNMTPLKYACEMGYLDIVKILCDKGALDMEKNDTGIKPALYIACKKGHEEIVSYLIEKGASTEVRYSPHILANGQNCLSAASKSSNSRICKKILSIHPNLLFEVNKLNLLFEENKLNLSYFKSAAGKGLFNTLKELLSHLTQASHINLAMMVSLNEACKYGKVEVVKLLLSLGIDLSKTNDYELYPLHEVCNYELKTANNLYDLQHIDEDYLEIVQLLINASYDVNAIDELGRPPILLASIQGHLDIVKALVDAGANMTWQTDLSNPLYRALLNGHLQTAKYLIEIGVILEFPANNLKPLILKACEESNLELAQMLIDLGADMNTPDMHGRTLMDYAIPSCIWSQLNF